MSYHRFQGLAEVYLEDSYVLDIQTRPFLVEFVLEAVLTERHPLYEPPHPGEQYCYRRARLRFTAVKEVHWLDIPGARFTDASGEVDYGNIDAFWYDGGFYHLSGDWGRLELASSPPVLVISRDVIVS